MESKIVYFNSRDDLLRIDLSQIVYFEAEGNYTRLITANKLKFTLGMNLARTEQRLAAQLGPVANRFMRIGKRFIVNIDYICQISPAKQQLTMTDYQRFAFVVPISKEALRRVKEMVVNSKIKKTL